MRLKIERCMADWQHHPVRPHKLGIAKYDGVETIACLLCGCWITLSNVKPDEVQTIRGVPLPDMQTMLTVQAYLQL